ncbi:MAG: glycosyltransferase, partial [Candidatus Riflebacteria bacterium]|nr:glycosyltransferase [Candidatus Riflebacteria bacterium]
MYLDRLLPDEAAVHYPSVPARTLVRPHVIGDAGDLSMFRGEVFDFLIASHVLEHLADPLTALVEWHRVVRPGGKLLLAVPDKRFTFDRDRPRTPLSHLLWNRREKRTSIEIGHFREWARHIEGLSADAAIGRAEELQRQGYAIHAHVWTLEDVLEILDYLEAAHRLGLRRAHLSGGPETTVLLEKPGARASRIGAARGLSLLAKAVTTLFTGGPGQLLARGRRFLARGRGEPDPYSLWIRGDLGLPAPRLEELHEPPLISVLTPVHEPAPAHLCQALESVRRQSYPRWEHVLVDDGSTDPDVIRLLRSAAAGPVRLVRHETARGIGLATQAALEQAEGAYVALLDHDDLLHPHALAEIARAASDMPAMIYTDEDKIDAAGVRCDPHFKPDWSPELMLSVMYTCHLMALQARRLREVGGFRAGFDGSQDYDAVLRVTEGRSDVVHVPRVLYHWRKAPGSAAADPDAKPWAYQAAARA